MAVIKASVGRESPEQLVERRSLLLFGALHGSRYEVGIERADQGIAAPAPS